MLIAKPSFIYLKDSEKVSVDSNLKVSIAIGAGFALGSAVFGSANIIVYSLGRAVFGIDGSTSVELILENSLKASALSLLNFFWTVMMYRCLESSDIRYNNASSRGDVDRNDDGDDDQQTLNGPRRTFNATTNKWLFLILSTHLINTIISLLGHNYAILSIITAWCLVIFVGYMVFYQLGGSKSSLKSAWLSGQNNVGLVSDQMGAL